MRERPDTGSSPGEMGRAARYGRAGCAKDRLGCAQMREAFVAEADVVVTLGDGLQKATPAFRLGIDTGTANLHAPIHPQLLSEPDIGRFPQAPEDWCPGFCSFVGLARSHLGVHISGFTSRECAPTTQPRFAVRGFPSVVELSRRP